MQKIVGADLITAKKSGKIWLVLDLVVPKDKTDDAHVGSTTNKLWISDDDIEDILQLDMSKLKLSDLVDRCVDTTYSLNCFGKAELSKITFYEEGGTT